MTCQMTRVRARTRLWHLVCAVAVVAVLAVALPVLADASPEAPASVAASSSLARNEAFEPIRIGVFAETLKNPKKTCLNVGDQYKDFLGKTQTCDDAHLVTAKRSERLVSTLMPAVVTRLQELLNVRRLTKPIAIPPSMDTPLCNSVDIPEDHRSSGVSGYDVVIYLHTFPETNSVNGVSCVAGGDDRPLVIVLGTRTTLIDADYTYTLWAAEVIQLLGFNGPMFTKKGLLAQRDVRGRPNTDVVLAGTALKREIEKQFGCADQEYLDLDPLERGLWSQRVMNFDIVAPVGATYFSGITIAALEDTGLYTGNYNKTDVSPWGFAGGCEFLNDPCLANSVPQRESLFCADTDKFYHCNAQRNALAVCDQGAEKPKDADWASGYGLWSDNEFLEYCPVYAAGDVLPCHSVNGVVPDPISGQRGACLDASQVQEESSTSFGVCAAVRCDSKKGTYDVQVNGETEWKPCRDGSTFEVSAAGGQTRTVECPPMYEVCVVKQEQLLKGDEPPSGPEEPPSGPGEQPPGGPGEQPPSGPGEQPPSGPGAEPETTTTRRPNGATRNSRMGSVVVAATLSASLFAISTL